MISKKSKCLFLSIVLILIVVIMCLFHTMSNKYVPLDKISLKINEDRSTYDEIEVTISENTYLPHCYGVYMGGTDVDDSSLLLEIWSERILFKNENADSIVIHVPDHIEKVYYFDVEENILIWEKGNIVLH